MWTRANLIAVIVVLAIVGLLAMPYLYRQRVMSRRLQCEKRMMEAARAFQRFESLQGRFPGYREFQRPTAAPTDGLSTKEYPAVGWTFPVLPYLGIRYEVEPTIPVQEDERTGPWKQIYDRSLPQGKLPHGPLDYIPDLVCPSDPSIDPNKPEPWTSFVVNAGCPDVSEAGELPPDWWPNGVCFDMVSSHGEAQYVSLDRLTRHDGAGATLMLSENVDAGLWTSSREADVAFVWVDHLVDGKPQPGMRLHRINRAIGESDGSLRFARPSSRHAGGVNVAYCDGRTTFLSEAIDYLALTYQMTSHAAQAKRPGTRQPVAGPYLIEDPDDK